MPRHAAAAALAFAFAPATLLAQAGTGTIRVSTAGSDAGSCGAAVSPCRNPQRAATLSVNGDLILLAAGSYTFQAGLDPCSAGIGATAVVCALNKRIVLRGGYDGASWASPAFGPEATVIDGQGSRRGVLVEDTAGLNRAAVTLENLTVAHGRGTARTAGSGDALIFGFGGGLDSAFAATVVRDVIFRDNLVLGSNSGGAYGGTGSGGAIALRGVPAGGLIERVVFLRNEARGGSGTQRGGYGIGGALFSYRSSYTGSDWTLLDNRAQAGSSAGSGVAGGQTADGLGGAVAFQLGTQATVERLVAHGNRALGGGAHATSGSAGGAFGGALYAEGALLEADATAVTLRDVRLEGNEARGAAARNGGYGSGGGLHTLDAGVVLERARVVGNLALGGNGTAAGNQGPAGGGGAAFTRSTPVVTALVRDSLFAANSVVAGAVGNILGGGGGGLWLQGLAAVIRDSTLVENRLGQSYLQGHAMVLLSFVSAADVDLQYSVVSDHVTPAGPFAVHVQTGSTLRFEPSLFAANSGNTNQGQAGAGTFVGLDAIESAAAVGYLEPGAPQHNYRLAPGSPAADPGSGSTATLDLDRAARDADSDFGAYELSAGRIFLDGFESGDAVSWR